MIDPVMPAINQLIIGAAPERVVELQDLWHRYSPHFAITEDNPGFKMNSGAYSSIIFTNKTLLQIWLLGFASWRAFVAYAPVLFLLQASGKPFELAVVDQLPAQSDLKMAFDMLLGCAEELGQLDNLDQFTWPSEVPLPGKTAIVDVADKAVYDLICLATAYVFLHEVQHVMFTKNSNAPSDPHAEEIACDRFARNFLIARIDDYVKHERYSYLRVLNKRAMGMALAMFVILEITPPKNWGGTRSHPPVGVRLRELIAAINLPSEEPFWIYTATLLISILRKERALPPSISFVDGRDLCDYLHAIM